MGALFMNKYDFKRSKFLLLAFFILTVMLLYLLMSINYTERISINVNDYISNEGKKFEVTLMDDSSKNILIESLKKTDVVHLESKDGYTYSYFNPQSPYQPTIEDFTHEAGAYSGLVYLGEEQLTQNEETFKNGEPYLFKGMMDSLETKVIGKIKSFPYDEKNYKSYLLLDFENDSIDYNGRYTIEGDSDFFFQGNHHGMKIESIEYRAIPLAGDIFNEVVFYLLGALIILILIAIGLISKYWFSNYEKEIGIRILCGGEAKSIFLSTVKKYIIVTLLGIVSGIVLYLVYILISQKAMFINVIDFLIIAFIVFLWGSLIAVFSFLKLIRQPIARMI